MLAATAGHRDGAARAPSPPRNSGLAHWFGATWIVVLIVVFWTPSVHAEEGYDLWLRYHPLAPESAVL